MQAIIRCSQWVLLGALAACASTVNPSGDIAALDAVVPTDVQFTTDHCVGPNCRCTPDAAVRECPLGSGCATGGACLPGCNQDSDCPVGRSCRQSDLSCFNPNAVVGTACVSSVDCNVGCRTEAEGPPQGECLGAICNIAMNDCSAGTVCVPLGEGVGQCVRGCMRDTDCRPAYRCATGPNPMTRRHCLPACMRNSDCPVTGNCDVASGLCRPL